jgi:hypothetical protein
MSEENIRRLKKLLSEPHVTEEYDVINHPSHYTSGEIETIDYIVDVLGKFDAIHYCHGTVHKYLGSRLWTKGDALQNAKKALWFLEKQIELMEETKGVYW